MSRLAQIKLSKINDIKHGQCIVLFPSGKLKYQLYRVATGCFNNILTFIDACLCKDDYTSLGVTREQLRNIIKTKPAGVMDYICNNCYHILTIYCPSNLLMVLTFYNGEEK
jgi:hypothetical protein